MSRRYPPHFEDTWFRNNAYVFRDGRVCAMTDAEWFWWLFFSFGWG